MIFSKLSRYMSESGRKMRIAAMANVITCVATFSMMALPIACSPAANGVDVLGTITVTKYAGFKNMDEVESWAHNYVNKPIRDFGVNAPLTLVKNGREVNVKTLGEYILYVNDGYLCKTNYDIMAESHFKKHVYPYIYAKQSLPPVVNYLDGFILTAENIKGLPRRLFDIASSKNNIDSIGGGLGEVTVIDNWAAIAKFDTMECSMEVLFYGDINHDSIGDALLFIASRSTIASYKSYNYVVITKRAKDGAIEVVEEK